MGTLIKDTIMVELESIGEGYNGDYDPEDPEDVELMRFSIFRLIDGKWEEIDNASYCTYIPASITSEQEDVILDYIMSQVYDLAVQWKSIKRACQRLSWLSDEQLSPIL